MAGPPCTPFTRLSTKRKSSTYHPFENDPNSEPFKDVAEYIRLLTFCAQSLSACVSIYGKVVEKSFSFLNAH